MATITETFNSGTGNWYAPKGVSNVIVEGIGAGGAGANRNANGVGGGGKGGGYSKLNSFPAVAGTKYPYSIGVGGNTNNNSNGTNTTFNTSSLLAPGGVTAGRNNATGQTTQVTSGIGDTVNDGGNGITGITAGGNNGGGGGSSGGNNGVGLDGVGNNGGGNGQGTLPGGAGMGGNGAKTASAVGSNGVFPGGAGGGATRNSATNRNGGNGANGQLKITYDYTPNALALSGSGQYGKINNWAAIDALVGNFTIEGWFLNDPTSQPYQGAAFVGSNSLDTTAIDLVTENGTGDEGVNFSSSYATVEADGFASSGVFTVSEWVHVAIVGTLNAATKIYRNGVEISYNLQNTPSGAYNTPTGQDFFMGHDPHATGPGPDWKGKIGGFLRMWNVSRTAQQLLDNKDLLLQTSKETGLIINLNFTEGAGTSIANESDGSHNMALTGSPSWTSGPATANKSYGGRQPRHGFINFQNPGLF